MDKERSKCGQAGNSHPERERKSRKRTTISGIKSTRKEECLAPVLVLTELSALVLRFFRSEVMVVAPSLTWVLLSAFFLLCT